VECSVGLGVRRRVSAPAPVLTPLVSFAAMPLMFGDLGGLARRDRGFGVAGGELETGLMPLLSDRHETLLRVSCDRDGNIVKSVCFCARN